MTWIPVGLGCSRKIWTGRCLLAIPARSGLAKQSFRDESVLPAPGFAPRFPALTCERALPTGSEKPVYCSTMFHPESGSNLFIAVAVSVVVFPRSFCSSTPSWSIMKVITPELPYSAG